MNLSPVFRQRFFDSNGIPLNGGKLYSYQAGTTTPQATYLNAAGTTNTNPVILDADGYADVWLDPTISYKFMLADSGNATIWTVDNVSFASGISVWGANVVYQQGSIAADTTGQLYVSLTNNNQGSPLTNVSAWRLFDGNIRTVSGNSTFTVTDEFVRSNSTSGNLTHTLPLCSTTPIGKKITVKDIGTGSNSTTIKGSGSDLVDGNNTYTTTLPQNCSASFENNGSSWDVLWSLTIPSGYIKTANLADASVTQVKRVALGQQVSASSGAFTTTSGTYVDVTNLSVTITTTGRPVYLGLNGGWVGVSMSGTDALGSLSIKRGSTAILTSNIAVSAEATDGSTVTQLSVPSSCLSFIDIPAAGTYTYKVQALALVTSTTSVNNATLVAFEL